ncbi:MAG: hypothetical protein JSV96_01455 [Candidatus Aminicenantes bacterium]|nr:MAG: hypothetical protein JSV96_01455 [Candidatus Aminicenantes bacterium]
MRDIHRRPRRSLKLLAKRCEAGEVCLPLAPFLKALGMAGGIKTAAAAGKVKEPLLTTLR